MNKSERFNFQLTPAERKALEELAELEGGLSLSALLRRLIRKEAQRFDLWLPEQKKENELNTTATPPNKP